MRNTRAASLRVGPAHQGNGSVPARLGRGPHDASARSTEAHPTGVTVTLQPSSSRIQQEKTTPLLTVPRGKDLESPTVRDPQWTPGWAPPRGELWTVS